MPRIWLPIGKPRQAVTEHGQIVLRLRELGVHVPGAHDLDISELREILCWQEEKAAKAVKSGLVTVQPRFSKEQVRLALSDALNFNKARREGRRRLY